MDRIVKLYTEGLEGHDDGKLKCNECTFKTNDDKYMQKHNRFHNKSVPYILYMATSGSLVGRNTIIDNISATNIECTGGQAAFEDNMSLQQFGDEIVAASRNTGVKIYVVAKIHDPGLGLVVFDQWIKAGVSAGVFKEYELPKDVDAN